MYIYIYIYIYIFWGGGKSRSYCDTHCPLNHIFYLNIQIVVLYLPVYTLD